MRTRIHNRRSVLPAKDTGDTLVILLKANIIFDWFPLKQVQEKLNQFLKKENGLSMLFVLFMLIWNNVYSSSSVDIILCRRSHRWLKHESFLLYDKLSIYILSLVIFYVVAQDHDSISWFEASLKYDVCPKVCIMFKKFERILFAKYF